MWSIGLFTGTRDLSEVDNTSPFAAAGWSGGGGVAAPACAVAARRAPGLV